MHYTCTLGRNIQGKQAKIFVHLARVCLLLLPRAVGIGGGARAMPGYIPTDFGRYATPYFNLAGPPHYYSPTPSDFQNLPTALPLGVKARVMPIMEFGYKNLNCFQF